MAYYSGTANSIADLLTALRNSAQSDGWTLSGNVLSRAGVHVEHTTSGNNLAIRGGLDGAMATPSPYMHIGQFSGAGNLQITYPCTWRYFGFADETWFVVNYDVTRHQMMAWGKSAVPGLPGSGAWVWASAHGQVGTGTLNSANVLYLWGSPLGVVGLAGTDLGGGTYRYAPAIWSYTDSSMFASGYVYHNFDGGGWSLHINSQSLNWSWLGNTGSGHLLAWQPSAWNGEIALLPLRAFVHRGGNRISLVLDHARARLCRIDNLQPADILTIGSTKWMVFPWHRREPAARDGSWDVDHTGTFGVAIQYEGP